MVKPNDEVDTFDLLDNGVNADTTLDDGVYSRYYINATQQGRYTVKCQVTSNSKTMAFERLGFIGSASPQRFGNPSPMFPYTFFFSKLRYLFLIQYSRL